MSVVESLFSQHSETRIPQFEVDDIISFIEWGNLLDLEQAIKEGNLHGVKFISKYINEKTRRIIEAVCSYVFNSTTRLKNLGIHIDSPDRPESAYQVLTGLYSPIDNYSNIPTICVDTPISDQACKEYITESHFEERYPDAFREVKQMIFTVLELGGEAPSEQSLGFWTNMLNICFVHRGLPEKERTALIEVRERFTKRFILTHARDISHIYPNKGEESLLIIPNGLSKEGRQVSHTRFSPTNIHERYSHGLVYNLGIGSTGEVHSMNPDADTENRNIKIGVHGVSMNYRETINPRKVI